MNSRTATAVVAAIATGLIGIGVGLLIGHDSGAAVEPVPSPAPSTPAAGVSPTATPQASSTSTPPAKPRASTTPTPRSSAGSAGKSSLTPLPIPTDPDTPGQEFMPNWAKQACTATVTGTAYHQSTSTSYYEITCKDGYVMGYQKRTGTAPTH